MKGQTSLPVIHLLTREVRGSSEMVSKPHCGRAWHETRPPHFSSTSRSLWKLKVPLFTSLAWLLHLLASLVQKFSTVFSSSPFLALKLRVIEIGQNNHTVPFHKQSDQDPQGRVNTFVILIIANTPTVRRAPGQGFIYIISFCSHSKWVTS